MAPRFNCDCRWLVDVLTRQQTAFVVDDNAAVRDALLGLLGSVDIKALGFATGEQFLDQLDPEQAGCAVLDVRMPGICGLALAQRMRDLRCELPIVFISAHGDVRLAVEAMRLGAEDFIEKPFRDQDVIDRVQRCLTLDHERYRQSENLRRVRQNLHALTARESLVLESIVQGYSNRDIAAALHVSPRTVETHRARVMKKMQAPCLATLVSMVTRVQTIDAASDKSE